MWNYIKGGVGALIVAMVIGSGYWLYWRYQEFVIMRDVVAQIIQHSQKQQTAAVVEK